MTPSGNLLVLYYVPYYPLRDAVIDHLYSFRRHSPRRCFYFNLASRPLPRFVTRIPFDAVIFHTTFLATRWSLPVFENMRRNAQPVKRMAGVRVALPQDEFLRTRQLCDFIDEFSVDLVCSVAPEAEWPTIYEGIDRDRTQICRVLTGYLERRTLDRISRLAGSTERTIDVGSRVRKHKPWLGRHGTMKGEITEKFERAAAANGLTVDISTSDDDILYGDDWYRLLLSSKYTIGAEGGASILDRDGTLMERTLGYLAEHPDAGFEEVEANCFPGRDGSFGLRALSPRHLEACATRTCQILVEGDYNGVLEPGVHYIPLRRDLSNLDDVIKSIKRDDRRVAMTDAAYRDIVESGHYEFGRFVAFVEATALPHAGLPARSVRSRLLYSLATGMDLASRVMIRALRRWSRLMVWGVRQLSMSRRWVGKALGR
jgi:hypothetical protein